MSIEGKSSDGEGMGTTPAAVCSDLAAWLWEPALSGQTGSVFVILS